MDGTVALLAEGVDRNHLFPGAAANNTQVALLAEGVDRNTDSGPDGSPTVRSPSSRRAWIEIVPKMSFYENNRVALLAEGVDRNLDLCHAIIDLHGRPPRGGRG